MIKNTILILIIIGLTGCGHQTPDYCEKNKYSGMVFSKKSTGGGECSMGTLSPSGISYMTDGGARRIAFYSYLRFENQQ